MCFRYSLATITLLMILFVATPLKPQIPYTLVLKLVVMCFCCACFFVWDLPVLLTVFSIFLSAANVWFVQYCVCRYQNIVFERRENRPRHLSESRSMY